MKQYTISTLHRTLASVLLFSQLLTSCGGAEMIVPASTTPQTQQHMGLSDENQISASSIGSPAPLAIPDEQGYASDASVDSFNSLPTYTTRQGHKIEFVQVGYQFLARVQEQLPPGFSNAPHTLPVVFQKDFFPEDLTPDTYVDVVFPRHANGNKGYVFCAEHRGLLGGMPQKHPQCDSTGQGKTAEAITKIVNRTPSSSVYSFYFYCHLQNGLVEKLDAESAERLNGLHLPLCIYNPSLQVLKETTQVKTKALEEYHKSTNSLEETLKRHETILNQEKEKLVEQQIKLERLKKVLEEAQNELMDK